LIEKLFSAKSYKELNKFMKTFDYEEPPSPGIYRPADRDIWDFYADSLSKNAAFIFKTEYVNNCDMYLFKMSDDGFAVVQIYQSGGPNDEPISIVHYFLPVKVLINLPYIRLYREISKSIDINSHKVFKNSCFVFAKRPSSDKNDAKALVRIESKHLKYFKENYCVPSYKRNVVYRSILRDWEPSVKRKLEEFDFGDVTIRFRVPSDGNVLWANVISNSSTESLASLSLDIIRNAVIPPIPRDVMDIIDHPYLDFEYSFSISPAKFAGEYGKREDRILKRPRIIM
jgi:hypothetical protein